MPRIGNGANFTCQHCGKVFYRPKSYIEKGRTKACSRACVDALHQGEGNPFHGKQHTQTSKATISRNRKGKALGNTNALGYRHTPEELQKIGSAARELWAKRRETPDMMAFKAMMPQRFDGVTGRIRDAEWTPYQRNHWRGAACAWCGSTERLELDHIVPRFLGGLNELSNAQTLCATCNRWKHEHIDTPMWLETQAKQGARINPKPLYISEVLLKP